ncbi:MAG: hypothetical protein ACOX3O_04660 [bacterium]|jgi:hypothetical protein
MLPKIFFEAGFFPWTENRLFHGIFFPVPEEKTGPAPLGRYQRRRRP